MDKDKIDALKDFLAGRRGTFNDSKLESINEAFIDWLSKQEEEDGEGVPDGALGKLYTPDEAARMLRVSPATVYRAIKSGALKARQVGFQYRIAAEDLENFGK